MTPDKDRTRLEPMRAATREALELVRGKRREDLDRDRLLNLALVRLLEIVDERFSDGDRIGVDRVIPI